MIRLIVKERGSGKTTELIKMAAENDYYMVVYSQAEASRVSAQAIDMGLNIRFPITYQELRDGRLSTNIKGLLIDEVQSLIQSLTRVPIKAVTWGG